MQKIKDIYCCKHSLIINIIIQMVFILIAVGINAILFFTPPLKLGVDGIYHIQEAKDITRTLFYHEWPMFNQYYGLRGVAVPTFYPYFGLLPLILGYIFHTSITSSMRIVLISTVLLLLETSYFSAKALYHNRRVSLLFSACMIISFQILKIVPMINDFDMAWALSAMVVAYFGWRAWIHDSKHWKAMSVGVTIEVLLNFPIAYLTIFTLIILTFAEFKKWTLPRIKTGLIASAFAVGISAFMWGPILVMSCENHIFTPAFTSVKEFISSNSMTIFILAPIDIFATISLLSYFKKLTYLAKISLIVSLVYFAIWINVIPISILAKTPLAYIQILSRFLLMGHLLLMISWVPLLYWNLSKESKIKYLIKLMLLFCCCSISIGLYEADLLKTVNSYSGHGSSVQRLSSLRLNGVYLDEFVPKKTLKYYLRICIHIPTLQRKLQTSHLPDTYIPPLFINHENGLHHIKGIPHGVSIYEESPKRNVILPIIVYQHQPYKFYLNGKRLSHYKLSHGELNVFRLPKGRDRITFLASVKEYRYLFLSVSILSLIVLIIVSWRDYRNKDSYN